VRRQRYRQQVHIPDLVRATVLGRVRLLHRVERSVLMCASVIGHHFDVALLTAAVTCTEGEVRAALERAFTLELIVVDDPSQGRYSFRHALTRDVIYADLITSRTRPLHRRIARALERITASGNVPIDDLAYHSWAAGDVRRGVRYNEQAGDRAAGVHAEVEARTYYGRARGLSEIGSHAYARLTAKLNALGTLGPGEIR
jgi:predicted ATPase